jgi:hypothetical protein
MGKPSQLLEPWTYPALRLPDLRANASLRLLDEYLGSVEMRLLMACCRRALGTLDEAAFAELAAASFDEAAFFKLCGEHRLSILVNKALVKPFRSRLSGGMAERFEREARRLMHSQLPLWGSMLTIHRAFAGESIRHLFLKGPILNSLLFGKGTLRYSRDLDILIEPESLNSLYYIGDTFQAAMVRVDALVPGNG